MANNLNMLDAIIAAKLGKGTGGGSGSVTKEYVDTQVGAVSERVDDVESVIPSAATPQNPLATTADVSGTAIHSTSTTSPLTDSADAMVQGLTIYGRSEVVDGAIKSAGDSGSIEIETCGKNLIDITKSADVVRPDGVTRNGFSFFGLNGTYTLSQGSGSSLFYYGVWNGNQWSETGTIQPNTSEIIILNATKSLWIWVAENQQMSQLITTAQLEYGSQATTYEPYNGTIATFTTGTPLRGIPDSNARDVMSWDGSARTVTKNCGEVDLGTLTWTYDSTYQRFYSNSILTTIKAPADGDIIANIITPKYITTSINYLIYTTPLPDKMIAVGTSGAISIRDTNYTDPTDFANALSGVKLVYELATPITTPLTDAEISAFRAFRTFDSTTNITITDDPEFEIDYLRNTENGQAVANIQRDLQGQISNMITVSPLLTLTAAGWDSTTKQQTVTFAHDTSRRNVIDITIGENAAWDAAGVYAVSETAAGITFECSEMPETALTFRVTSMEVS